MSMIRYRRDLHQVIRIPGDAAEIGVAEGRFSEEILNWNVYFPHLYMVDRWRCVPTQKGDAANPQGWHDANMMEAMRSVRKFGPRAVILRGDSVAMASRVADRTLAFLYIDCDHSYEGVTADLNAWVPKVDMGGVVALHDFENPNYGVKQAVLDFLRPREWIYHSLPEDKPEDAGAFFYVC